MPIHKVAGGWQWGSHGHVYPNREGAVKQAQAAHANGYEGDRAPDTSKREFRQLMAKFIQFFGEEADEPEHAEDSIRAAGVAVMAPSGRLLMMKRQGGVAPGTWAFPGGHAEGAEEPHDCALRELREETGYTAAEELDPLHRSDNGYILFGHYSPEEFEPRLNEEHSEARWVSPDDLPMPLHPGVKAALAPNSATAHWARRRHEGAVDGGDVPKEVVRYSKSTGEDCCRRCEHFRGGTCAVVAGEINPTYWCERFSCRMGADRIAIDAESVREYDRDGRLHVRLTHISKACINPYLGSEIPGAERLSLDPKRAYMLLRDPAELAKAAPTFNGLPLLIKHKPHTAEEHDEDVVIGSTGTLASFSHPYLDNSLVVWPQHAIDVIEDESKRELSCGYHYRADMTPGYWEGQRYDGVMRDIVGNHVALVEKGRAGSDVVVGDSALVPTTIGKELDMAKFKSRLGIYVHGVLSGVGFNGNPPPAAALALDGALAGVSGKTWPQDKPKIKAAIKLIKETIAKDANLVGMESFLDGLTEASGPVANDAELNEKGVEAPRHIPEGHDREHHQGRDNEEFDPKKFLKSKLSAEDYDAYEREQEAHDRRRAKDEEEKSKAEEERRAEEKKREEEENRKGMDSAIQAAIAAERTRQSATREAYAVVRPWVGELAIACDSAEQVYREALTALKVPGADKMHPDALRAVLEVQPKPGPRSRGVPTIAADAAGSEDFTKRFPNAARIGRI